MATAPQHLSDVGLGAGGDILGGFGEADCGLYARLTPQGLVA